MVVTCAQAHNDKVQGAVAAEFAIKKLNIKKAATVHDGSPYAEQLAAVFAETFKKLGGTIMLRKPLVQAIRTCGQCSRDRYGQA